MRERWIRVPSVDQAAMARLFCFPHAGGGPSLFRSFRQPLSPDISTCPIQLPGREARACEPSLAEVSEIADRISECIAALSDKPFAFFGHSMGAIVAFEVAKRLSKARPHVATPTLLVVSASPPPHLAGKDERGHLLGDRELLEWVRGLGGTSDVVLEHPELRRVFLPPLRADLAALANYRSQGSYQFEGRMLVLGGREDALVPRDVLAGWRAYAMESCTQDELPGGHFYFSSKQELVVQTIRREMLRAMFELSNPPIRDKTRPGAAIDALDARGSDVAFRGSKGDQEAR
jgi:medium-chain acyl-[acyl-carrier-protein] hydrolase